MKKTITLQMIISEVEIYFGIDDLSIRNKTNEYVFPRHVYCELTREFCPKESLESVGRSLMRNHATVINSRNQFESLSGQYIFKDYKKGYEVIKENLTKKRNLFLLIENSKCNKEVLKELKDITEIVSMGIVNIPESTIERLKEVKQDIYNHIEVTFKVA